MREKSVLSKCNGIMCEDTWAFYKKTQSARKTEAVYCIDIQNATLFYTLSGL